MIFTDCRFREMKAFQDMAESRWGSKVADTFERPRIYKRLRRAERVHGGKCV